MVKFDLFVLHLSLFDIKFVSLVGTDREIYHQGGTLIGVLYFVMQ